MSEDQPPATSASLTLMAGLIDCRISPTAVNRLAVTKPIAWFEKNLISRGPWPHTGRRRRVYPGFVQLSAFMRMNKQRHIDAFKAYYQHLAADFYLETVRLVFQDHALAKGDLRIAGRLVNPAAIRRTALLTVEGERDDLCAIGQTLAAQDLASSRRPYLRTHCVQPDVGHYGVFSGKRWQRHIYPLVRDVIHVSQ